MTQTPAAADFVWENVVIGADIDAVRFAHDNKHFLIKNREPHHHSYEDVEDEWARRLYELYDLGLSPFVDKCTSVRVLPKKKLIKVFVGPGACVIKYNNLYLYDDHQVEGVSLNRDLIHYRVIDWFDCQGLYDLDCETLKTNDRLVNKVKFFKTTRIDGDQKYLDLLCESFLNEEQLKSFDCSDTMVRFKIENLLKERGAHKVTMSLWKRDIYPVYK